VIYYKGKTESGDRRLPADSEGNYKLSSDWDTKSDEEFLQFFSAGKFDNERIPRIHAELNANVRKWQELFYVLRDRRMHAASQ
jgi:hypothetical protein